MLHSYLDILSVLSIAIVLLCVTKKVHTAYQTDRKERQMNNWQALIGVRFDNGYEAYYCRETLGDLPSETAARDKANRLLAAAARPPKGTLFLKSVENWG